MSISDFDRISNTSNLNFLSVQGPLLVKVWATVSGAVASEEHTLTRSKKVKPVLVEYRGVLK